MGVTMNKSVPWSIKGVGFDAREAAKEAARRSGMTVGEWLHSVIAERAQESGLDYDDIDTEDQIEAVTARLASLSEPNDEIPPRRHSRAIRRAAARQTRYDPQTELSIDDDDLAPRRRRAEIRRAYDEVGRADAPQRASPTRARVTASPPETLLDEAVRIFEMRHQDHAQRTDQALGKVARRLAEIEAHITSRDEPEHARSLRAAMESLETRVEHLARSKAQPGKIDQALEDIEAQLARLAERLPNEPPATAQQPAEAMPAAGGEHLRRIEDKLNRLISSIEAPTEVVFPAGRDQKPSAASDAVSEILRHQRKLYDGAAGTSRKLFPPAAGDALTTPIYATAPTRRSSGDDIHSALQSGISSLADQIEALRKDSRQSEERRRAEAGSLHPDLAFLRRQLDEISEAVKNIAQRGSPAALERAMRDLAIRIDESRRLGVSSESLEPIEQILADIRHSISTTSPAVVLESLQEELTRLHAKIDAMTMHGFDRVAFDALTRQTDEIGRLLAQVLARPMPIEGLERQVALLTDRVDRLTIRSDEVSPYLVETLDSIRASIDRLGSNPVLRDIESRVSDLAARSGHLPTYLVDMLEEMRQSIDNVAANPAFRAVQKQVTDLASRSGDLPPELVAMLAELQRSVENVSTNPALRAIETQVAELSARTGNLPDHLVETLHEIRASIERMATNAGVTAIASGVRQAMSGSSDFPDHLADTLDQMRASIERMSEQPGLRSIEAQVAELASKIDGAIAHPRPSAPDGAVESQKIYGRISDLHDALIHRLEQGSAQGLNPAFEGQIANLTHRIEDVHRAVVKQAEAGPRVSASDDRLQDMVSQLAERIERISQGQGDTRALQALENQIIRLSERLERTGETAEAIGALERAMSDMFSQLEETRHAAIDAAESAARETVRQSAVGNAQAIDPDIIVREISELRSLQGESDRRTHSTLTAVHETLEKVVDRLALLEDDLGDMRSFEPSYDEGRLSDPAPAVEQARFASQSSHGAPVPAERHGERLPPVADFETSLVAPPVEPPRIEQSVASPAMDVLIEPGSGFAPTRRGFDQADPMIEPASGYLNEPAITAERDSRGAQASFIAAARRAAQTAAPALAVEADSAKARKSSSVENALSEARSRARAAAASFERQGRIPSADATGSMLRGKARPILLSIAGLFLLLGALQIARSVVDAPVSESELVEPLPKLSETPALPEKRVQLESLPAPTGSASTGPGASADPVIVGSIPAPPASSATLIDLANAGNVAAQYELAARYADGRDMKRDPALAVTWFRKAAEKDHAPSQYRLGALFEKGIGVARSPGEAANWYRKAANNGNVRAMHNLAVLIADGIEGKPDYAQAATWFRNAAEHGVRDSQYNLAILFARGLGVEQDLAKSYLWFALAAAQGDTDAQKKRDEISARIQPRQLAEAKVAVDTFELRKPSTSANESASVEGLLNAPRADIRPAPAAPPSVAPMPRAAPGTSNSGKSSARVSAL